MTIISYFNILHGWRNSFRTFDWVTAIPVPELAIRRLFKYYFKYVNELPRSKLAGYPEEKFIYFENHCGFQTFPHGNLRASSRGIA